MTQSRSQIKKIIEQLEMLWNLKLDLNSDGIPETDPVYVNIEKRMQELFLELTALSFPDPETRYFGHWDTRQKN